jgi:hypothetical protein
MGDDRSAAKSRHMTTNQFLVLYKMNLNLMSIEKCMSAINSTTRMK